MSNPDGSFRRTIDPADVPTDVVWDGATAWRYVGQATLADGSPDESSIGELGRPRPLLSAREQIYATTRVDDLGRAWAVDDLDEDLLCQRIWAEDPEFDCDLDSIPDEIEPPEDPEIVEYQPTGAWHAKICSTTGAVHVNSAIHWYDNDLRTTRQNWSDVTMRQAKVVSLHTKVPDQDFPNLDFLCSGVVYQVNKVLTAAHCVVQEGNFPLDPDDLVICTHGNGYQNAPTSTCVDVTAVDPFYNWDWNDQIDTIAHDFAVLTVTTDPESMVGGMGLTTRSASYIMGKNDDYFNLAGFTAHTLDATVTGQGAPCELELAEQGTNPTYNKLKVVHEKRRLQNIQDNVLSSRHASSSGESGGPIYWCQDGSCVDENDPTNPGRVVAVLSGFTTSGAGSTETVGAFAPSRHAWVSAQ